jgi:hypothetical protein
VKEPLPHLDSLEVQVREALGAPTGRDLVVAGHVGRLCGQSAAFRSEYVRLLSGERADSADRPAPELGSAAAARRWREDAENAWRLPLAATTTRGDTYDPSQPRDEIGRFAPLTDEHRALAAKLRPVLPEPPPGAAKAKPEAARSAQEHYSAAGHHLSAAARAAGTEEKAAHQAAAEAHLAAFERGGEEGSRDLSARARFASHAAHFAPAKTDAAPSFFLPGDLEASPSPEAQIARRMAPGQPETAEAAVRRMTAAGDPDPLRRLVPGDPPDALAVRRHRMLEDEQAWRTPLSGSLETP